MDRDEIINTLRGTPDQVQAICAPLTDDQLRHRPADAAATDESGWSLLELICHLRDSAQEDGLRIRRLVEEDNPMLVPYDQEAWARDRNYNGDDPKKALVAMRAFVSGLAYQLENLSEQQWSRAGHHPERGAVSVLSMATQYATHHRDHVAQMRGVASAVSPP
jgi:hypothetical protein